MSQEFLEGSKKTLIFYDFVSFSFFFFFLKVIILFFFYFFFLSKSKRQTKKKYKKNDTFNSLFLKFTSNFFSYFHYFQTFKYILIY